MLHDWSTTPRFRPKGRSGARLGSIDTTSTPGAMCQGQFLASDPDWRRLIEELKAAKGSVVNVTRSRAPACIRSRGRGLRHLEGALAS